MTHLPFFRPGATHLALCLAAGFAVAGSPAAARAQGATEATARYFDRMRADPPQLEAFLREMPKGADLHNHLSGAVYAESLLQWAAQDSLCIARSGLTLVPPPCDPATKPPAAAALRDAGLYGDVIDAWSMRNWNPARQNGHDQFFATFGRFGAVTGGRRTGDMLAEEARIAADDRVAYVETMLTPDGASARLARVFGWHDDMARLRRELLDSGFVRQVLADARATYDSAEAREKQLLGCGTPQAGPGCGVTIRYLYQVARARAPEEVFARIMAGFEVASADPRVVGLNLVQPEDDYTAMKDYELHMRMIRYLQPFYPTVKVALHAGELAPGLVPPEGLRFHVRDAVEVAGARRIGHGVDIMEEDRPAELLRRMARGDVLVEICLTSNDAILGVVGRQHPLHAYLDAGVPVALATDDQGVARSSMTREYLRAAQEQGLGYVQLKTLTRNGMQHAFIGGASLWADPRRFVTVAVCAGGAASGGACRAYLDANPRARLQWELERAFDAFEARYTAAASSSSARANAGR